MGIVHGKPSLQVALSELLERYQQDTVGQFLLASHDPGESLTSADLQRSHERVIVVREEERRHLAREFKQVILIISRKNRRLRQQFHRLYDSAR